MIWVIIIITVWCQRCCPLQYPLGHLLSGQATVLERRWRQTQNVISVVLLHMTINRAADLRQDTDRLGAPSQWAWWVMKLVQHSVFIVCLREWRSPLRSLCIFHVSYAAGINGSNYALARARTHARSIIDKWFSLHHLTLSLLSLLWFLYKNVSIQSQTDANQQEIIFVFLFFLLFIFLYRQCFFSSPLGHSDE